MNTYEEPNSNTICVVDIKEGKIRATFNDSLIQTYDRLLEWAQTYEGRPLERMKVIHIFHGDRLVDAYVLSKNTVFKLMSRIEDVRTILDRYTFEDDDDGNRWCAFTVGDDDPPNLEELSSMNDKLPLCSHDHRIANIYSKWAAYFSEWGNVLQALIYADGYINELEDGVLQLAVTSEHL